MVVLHGFGIVKWSCRFAAVCADCAFSFVIVHPSRVQVATRAGKRGAHLGLIYDRLPRQDFRLRAYNCPDFDIRSAAVKIDSAIALAAEDEHDSTRSSNFGDKGAHRLYLFQPCVEWMCLSVCCCV